MCLFIPVLFFFRLIITNVHLNGLRTTFNIQNNTELLKYLTDTVSPVFDIYKLPAQVSSLFLFVIQLNNPSWTRTPV